MLSARHYLGALLNLRPFFSWWFPICTEHTYYFCFCISSPPSFLFVLTTHIFSVFVFLLFLVSYLYRAHTFFPVFVFVFLLLMVSYLYRAHTHFFVFVYVFLLIMVSNYYRAHTFFSVFFVLLLLLVSYLYRAHTCFCCFCF